MDEPDPDQRAEPRHPIELKVEYKRLNSFLADYTRNISRGGTFIKTGRPLPVGTEFVFKLFVPHLARPLAIHGEVQRVVTEAEADERRIDPGMGIRFVYREGDSREVIAQAVEKLMIDSLGENLSRKLLDARPADEGGAGAGADPGPGKGGTP